MDLQSLCVLPGKSCWVLHIDGLVLNADGSVLDALSLATKVNLSLMCPPPPSSPSSPLGWDSSGFLGTVNHGGRQAGMHQGSRHLWLACMALRMETYLSASTSLDQLQIPKKGA